MALHVGATGKRRAAHCPGTNNRKPIYFRIPLSRSAVHADTSRVKIEQISMDCASSAEGLDAMEEIRYLFELADDGGVDLGPAVRSLLTNAYFAVDRELQSEACA